MEALRIALLVFCWHKIISVVLQRLMRKKGFGSLLPGDGFVPPAPSVHFFWTTIKKKSTVYARGRSLCLLVFNDAFYGGTSLGSKPCSDSCRVNHLRKSQQQSSNLGGRIRLALKLSNICKKQPYKTHFTVKKKIFSCTD